MTTDLSALPVEQKLLCILNTKALGRFNISDCIDVIENPINVPSKFRAQDMVNVLNYFNKFECHILGRHFSATKGKEQTKINFIQVINIIKNREKKSNTESSNNLSTKKPSQPTTTTNNNNSSSSQNASKVNPPIERVNVTSIKRLSEAITSQKALLEIQKFKKREPSTNIVQKSSSSHENNVVAPNYDFNNKVVNRSDSDDDSSSDSSYDSHLLNPAAVINRSKRIIYIYIYIYIYLFILIYYIIII